MNICYVANNRFPSERAHMTQIVQMCNAFVKNGHQVTLLVTDRKTSIKEEPEAFFGTKFSFSFVRIFVPDVAGRSHHIPVFSRPYAFLFQRLIFSYRASKYIKKHSFSHVYGRDEWVLWLLSFLIKIPIVWESHEAKVSYAARRIFSKIKKIIVISEGIRDFYLKYGIERERILVAHDAVDERFFESLATSQVAQKALGIKSQKPVAMYIGGLEEWKGAETLFEASKDQDNFEVYVIGGKDIEVSTLQQKYPHVHFLGSRPYRDLPLYQQAADILIIPNTAKITLSAEYTSPLKLFTYMTSQKPIVASRIPSIRNVLEEDEAFFFIADDPVSLRDAINEVIGDAKKSEVRANNAYKKSRQYTWVNRAKNILDFVSA